MINIQKSFDKGYTEGILYIVPTPIGNLEDITYRGLRILKEVSIVAAEDTRNTRKLFNHFEITTHLISYHEHNKLSREEQLLGRLEQGEDVAVVSDAGMPGISDPGYELIKSAIANNKHVVVLPGANAAICALVGSGLETSEFLFHGFLPRKKKDKETELKRLQSLKATLVFYESPHRIKETLKVIGEQFGNRRVAIAREITKKFEEYVRGTVEELIVWTEESELKGEFCIVVAGDTEDSAAETLWWGHLSVAMHIEHYMQEADMSSKEAIKQTAVDRKMQKRDVYATYHLTEEKEDGQV